jgi:hypothetical protein
MDDGHAVPDRKHCDYAARVPFDMRCELLDRLRARIVLVRCVAQHAGIPQGIVEHHCADFALGVGV